MAVHLYTTTFCVAPVWRKPGLSVVVCIQMDLLKDDIKSSFGEREISERITSSIFLLSTGYKPFRGVPFLSFPAAVIPQTPRFPERRRRVTARKQ